MRSVLDIKHLRARNGIPIGIAVGGLATGLVLGTAGIAGVVSLVAGLP